MAKVQEVSVRLERQPNRGAVERLREAYQRLSQAARAVEAEAIQQPDQETKHEPVSGDLRPSVNAPAGARSDH